MHQVDRCMMMLSYVQQLSQLTKRLKKKRPPDHLVVCRNATQGDLLQLYIFYACPVPARRFSSSAPPLRRFTGATLRLPKRYVKVSDTCLVSRWAVNDSV